MTTEKEQLEAEIAKRDARIAELERQGAALAASYCDGVIGDSYGHAYCKYKAELAALKAQQPSAGVVIGALVSALEGIVHDERVPNEVSQDYAALLIEARRLNPSRAQDALDGWRMVKVGAEGVQFGNAWFSHEGITGYTAEQLNGGNCRVTGRAYMDWLAAAPSTQHKESE